MEKEARGGEVIDSGKEGWKRKEAERLLFIACRLSSLSSVVDMYTIYVDLPMCGSVLDQTQ